MKKHHGDLLCEPEINESDLILVQQTCLKSAECTEEYNIEGYMNNFNSAEDGKGIALYHKEGITHVSDLKKENYQITKLQSEKYDIVCVYRSSDSVKSNQIKFLSDLRNFILESNQTLIFGDFNFDAVCPNQNFILRQLENWNFQQLIQNPTHIQGGVIDHCYINNTFPISSVEVSQKPVYYTDHDIIKVIMKNA